MRPGTEPDYLRLNDLLWRYRRAVDRYVFLLEVQLMVVEVGRADWLPPVTDLFDELADRLTQVEREWRTVLGPSVCSLAALAAAATEPWPGIIIEHRDRLQDALREANDLRQRNRQAISAITAGLGRLFDAVGARIPAPGSGRSTVEQGA
ncbi:MAG: hypothetical protein ACK5PP_12705 [Acidimicrobiales bacterium]